MELKNVKVESVKDYVESLLKSLSNFCSKCPIQTNISYVQDLNKVFIKVISNVEENCETITIEINPLDDKKNVIRNVKTKLLKKYPIIYDRVKKTPTPEQLEKMIEVEGMSVKDALNTISEKDEVLYTIQRVHNLYNELDVYDEKNKQHKKFKSKIPVCLLLKKFDSGMHIIYEDIAESLVFLYDIEKK